MGLTLPTLGCSDAFNAGPLEYVESEALTKDIPGKANLAGKPMLQAKVRQGLINLFGENPQRIKVPEGRPTACGRDLLGELSPGRRGRGRPDQAESIVPFLTARPISRVLKRGATRSIAGTASIATAYPVPATDRPPRSCIHRPAIIARGSSSSPPPPLAALARTGMIFDAPSRTACMVPRCRRSMRFCRRTEIEASHRLCGVS